MRVFSMPSSVPFQAKRFVGERASDNGGDEQTNQESLPENDDVTRFLDKVSKVVDPIYNKYRHLMNGFDAEETTHDAKDGDSSDD